MSRMGLSLTVLQCYPQSRFITVWCAKHQGRRQDYQHHTLNVSLEGSAREMGESFTQEGSMGLIQGLWVLLTCSITTLTTLVQGWMW